MPIPTRERCCCCHHYSPVGFHVPNDVWEASLHPEFHNARLCIMCFARMADEKLVRWDDAVKLYPVSLATHLEAVGITVGQTASPIANNLGAIQRALEEAGVELVFEKGKPKGINVQARTRR